MQNTSGGSHAALLLCGLVFVASALGSAQVQPGGLTVADGGRTVSRPVDLATIPIYARGGSIIPVDPIRQDVSEPVTDPTTLRVFPGASGQFTLYEDDGVSQAYFRNRGSWIRMTWNDRSRQLTLEPGRPAGASDVVTTRVFTIVLSDGQLSGRPTRDVE